MKKAEEFIQSRPGRRGSTKVQKFIELTPERAQWLQETAQLLGLSQVEIIEAGIDALRQAQQEVTQQNA